MINDLIKTANEKGIKIEVKNNKTKNCSIETFNKKVEKYVISNNDFYEIKALYKDKNVFMTSNNIDDKEKIINSILNLYDLSDSKDLSEFAKSLELERKSVNPFNLNYKNISKFLISLNDLKKSYKELKNINAGFTSVENEINIVNEKTHLKDYVNYIESYVEVVIKVNDITETNYFTVYDNKFDEDKLKNKTIKLIEETIDRINASSIKTINTNVILNNKTVFSILSAFSDMFFAEPIRFKTSVLTDKYNTKVFSDKLTIIEDPLNKNMIISRLFDDEGTKTNYKEIISNGVFKVKLSDNKEALLDKTKSTGNSYGVLNMYIKPGEKDEKELITELNNGLLITEVRGIHSGINEITGDFSVQCVGYEIKNGSINRPIKMFVMSSNIIELFNNVIDIGSDLEFFGPTGGSPSMLISNVDIAGSEN